LAKDNSTKLLPLTRKLKMIRIECSGGLGNQLFVWAAAHELAQIYDQNVELFYHYPENGNEPRRFELQSLLENCEHGISAKNSKSTSFYMRVIDFMGKYPKSRALAIRILSIDENLDPCREIVRRTRIPRITRGFFQNDSLVERNRELLLPELEKTLDSIQGKNSRIKNGEKSKCAIHIRRGDSVANKDTTGVLRIEYYSNGINGYREVNIFSDDAKVFNLFQNNNGKYNFFSPTDMTTWETLKKISQSEVIFSANSTFSWWASKIAMWRYDSTVYFPHVWTKKSNMSFERIYPKDVIRLEALYE
jgi:hypothetical protein